jgi:hypothetical protein
MDITQYLITTGIPTAAVLIVGFILRRQIKSQSEIIEKYKAYIETIDWRKVKDHYEEFRIPQEVEKAKKEVIDQVEKQVRELTPMVDDLVDQHLEMTRFCAIVLLNHLDKETGQSLVRASMPKSEQAFVKIWAFLDQHSGETQ